MIGGSRGLGVCVYCGYCVEVCPEDAIRMDTGILDVAACSREAMRLDIHELMDPGLRKPISQCNDISSLNGNMLGLSSELDQLSS